MSEPKQREKLVITEAGHDLSLVFDFDPKHPSSTGRSQYGPWTKYTVRDGETEWTLFASGWLMTILPELGIQKKGQKFSIKRVPYIGEDNKAKSAFQITWGAKTYDSRDGVKFNKEGEVADIQDVEFQDLEGLRKEIPQPEAPKPVPQKGTTVPESDPVADKLNLLKRIMKGYIKLCKEVADEEQLGEDGWLRLYDKTHISSAFINLSKN